MYEIRRSPRLTEHELVHLFETSWPNYAPRSFAPVLERSLAYFAAFAGRTLIGFVNVAWDGGLHAFILDTTVHPDFRRRGVASALLGRAAEAARSKGVVWLHVDFEPEAERLYRKAGYRPTAAGVLRLQPAVGQC
ncbi:MAG TPA: GNAT family N-acetyltransferase [Terrimicrobiaceae bacterium]